MPLRLYQQSPSDQGDVNLATSTSNLSIANNNNVAIANLGQNLVVSITYTTLRTVTISNDQSMTVTNDLNVALASGDGGSVDLSAGGLLSVQNIHADSLVSQAGTITLSGGSIVTGNLSAQTLNSAAPGGNIAVTGGFFNIPDVNVNSPFGSGGTFVLTLTQNVPITFGPGYASNGIGQISADGGVDGGTIKLNIQPSTVIISAGTNITANGGTGTGGLIQFTSPTYMVVVINGVLQAKNGTDDSGLVQFLTQFCSYLYLWGTGTIHGGYGVDASNLRAMGITIDPNLTILNRLFATPCPECFVPPTPAPSPIQPNAGPNLGLLALQARIAADFNAANLGLAARVPTDVERLPPKDLRLNPEPDAQLLCSTGLEIALAEALVERLDASNRQTLSQLQDQGLSITPAADGSLNLQRGVLMLAPEQTTTIHTNNGDVTIRPGAIALIVTNGENTAIYDIHDFNSNDITVHVGPEGFHMSPGLVTVLTKQSADNMDMVTTGKRIAYRAPRRMAQIGGTIIYSAEFSTTSAVAEVKLLRTLFHSQDPRNRMLADRLMKTASIRNLIKPGGEPFRQPK